MKVLHCIALILIVIGGLNWLLVGVFGWDVGVIFGGAGAIGARVIYIVIGLAAVLVMVSHKKHCHSCGTSSMPMSNPM